MESVGDGAERLAQAIGFDLAERDEPRQRLEHRRDAGGPHDRDGAAFDRIGDVDPSVLAHPGRARKRSPGRTRRESSTRPRTTGSIHGGLATFESEATRSEKSGAACVVTGAE